MMAFLQRIINGGVRLNREMALGRGRTNLLIHFAGERFVLELKVKNQNYKQEKSCFQLSRYLDTVGLSSGYLIVFEPTPSSKLSWEQRIQWHEVEFEWQGKNRKITVVEM